MCRDLFLLALMVSYWGIRRNMFKFVRIRDGKDNFFTPLRLVLAVIVMIGHCFYVTSEMGSLAEPRIFFDYPPGFLAVNVFFIVSGFLVTKSVMYRGASADFVSARILRIMPALIAHILFLMFVMGPFVTSLPLKAFFTHPEFLTQPLKALTFYRTEMVLPGALENNHANVSSATLWTLRYELMAYLGTGLLFYLGFMKQRWMIMAQFLILATLWYVVHFTGIYDNLLGTIQRILRLGMGYSIGAAIYAYRDKISFHILGIPILGFIAVTLHDTIMFKVMTDIWLAYIIFWIAYIKIPKLEGLQNMTDISYGIYIYHYCLQQWVFHINPDVNVLELFLWSTPLTVLMALASWHLVEKPMLAKRDSFAKFLRRSKLPGGHGHNIPLRG